MGVVPDDCAGALPKVVILDIPTYTGPPLFEQPNDEEGNKRRRYWVPIVPKKRAHVVRPWLVRRQVPLRLAYCITFNKSQGMSLSRPTVLDFSASTPTSNYKPLRWRELAFVGMTRISDKQFLAFRNLPDFQEFEMLMRSASFKERIQHDRAMCAKHVQTMQELFGISPEEEAEVHRKWDAARGMPSNWIPPSELDKKPKNRLCPNRKFSLWAMLCGAKDMLQLCVFFMNLATSVPMMSHTQHPVARFDC